MKKRTKRTHILTSIPFGNHRAMLWVPCWRHGSAIHGPCREGTGGEQIEQETPTQETTAPTRRWKMLIPAGRSLCVQLLTKVGSGVLRPGCPHSVPTSFPPLLNWPRALFTLRAPPLCFRVLFPSSPLLCPFSDCLGFSQTICSPYPFISFHFLQCFIGML